MQCWLVDACVCLVIFKCWCMDGICMILPIRNFDFQGYLVSNLMFKLNFRESQCSCLKPFIAPLRSTFISECDSFIHMNFVVQF